MVATTQGTRHDRRAQPSAAALLACILIGTVVLLWRPGHARLNFDETFTAMAARLPVGRLLPFLRHHDAHPPLDYLVRRPFALAGASEFWLRLPSVVFGIATLGVFAWFMRRHGRLGLLAAALLALSSFQLTYAWDARPYAAMALLGVVAAAAADRWLVDGSARASATVGAAALGASLVHSSALVLVGGLLLVPGLRRDRHAWEWRGALFLALGVWAGLWGPAFREQLARSSASWIPFTTPDYLGRVVNELVSPYPAQRAVVLPIVVLGLVALRVRDRPLGRITACLFLAPLLVSAAIGLRSHYLLPRSLAYASWAPLTGLAAGVDWMLARSRALGIAAACLVAVLTLPGLVATAKAPQPDTARVLAEVANRVAPGEAVAIRPPWLDPLIRWYLGIRRSGTVRTVDVRLWEASALLVSPGPWNGRVWIVQPVVYRYATPGYTPCSPPRVLDGYRLQCFEQATR